MNRILKHTKRPLWVPAYEERLMHPDWFDKTYHNLPRHTQALRDNAGERRTLIQAGGHLGIWPEYLSHYFKRVISFEPSETVFECLEKNTAHRPNIECVMAALGDENKSIGFYQSGWKTGTDTCVLKDGMEPSYNVSQIRIDDMCLDDVDAIFLDIELYEVSALMGARETIEKFSPVIQVELHDKAKDAIDGLLTSWGYRLIDRVSKDGVYVRDR